MVPVVFKNVVKYFEDGIIPKRNYAVKDISFNLEQGKTYAYLGPNGAGKTTTIKLLMNFLNPSKGEIRVFGKSPSDPSGREKIGYVSDHPYFYEYLTAEEYLAFCGELYGMNRSRIRERSAEMFSLVGLDSARKMKLRKFSRGMGQRLSFAQALLNDPELIVLDEPLNGLDPFGRKDLQNLILELKKLGKTIFFSSHILDDAELLADELLFINNGEIIFKGTLDDIREKSTPAFQIYLEHSSEKITTFCNNNNLTTEDTGNVFAVLNLNTNTMNELVSLVASEKIRLQGIDEHHPKLEELFLNYYRGKENEDH